MANQRGGLFIVSAPSGAGKTTLCNKLVVSVDNIRHSVSYTTRKPRPGEINDVHYTFITEPEFYRMVDEGEFAEWAKVHGNLYGTSGKRLDELRDKGVDALLDIDVQGAVKLRGTLKDGVYIFILPPSFKVLKDRLYSRMCSTTAEEMDLRLKNAMDEIRMYNNYDYVIINDVLEEAFLRLKSIVIAERSRIGRFGRVEENLFEPEEAS